MTGLVPVGGVVIVGLPSNPTLERWLVAVVTAVVPVGGSIYFFWVLVSATGVLTTGVVTVALLEGAVMAGAVEEFDETAQAFAVIVPEPLKVTPVPPDARAMTQGMPLELTWSST